jgi:hypothetical protein
MTTIGKPPLGKGAWDAGKPSQKLETPNPFSYSREFLLEQFALNLDLPAETNLEIEVFHTDCREPLAFVPLSDQEKKVTRS